jgi:hypothetical protein
MIFVVIFACGTTTIKTEESNVSEPPSSSKTPALSVPTSKSKHAVEIETRVFKMSGVVKVLRRGNTEWEKLTESDVFGIEDYPIFRVSTDSYLILELPDGSRIAGGQKTVFLFSQNERREISLAQGVLDIHMNPDSTDRAGMQVRTIGGIVRGPQASFTIATDQLWNSVLFVENGVVYAGDEKTDLKYQEERARETVKTGKEPAAKKAELYYQKIPPGSVTSIKSNGSIEVSPSKTTFVQSEENHSLVMNLQNNFVKRNDWEETFYKSLDDCIKTSENNIDKLDERLEEINKINVKTIGMVKEKKLSIVEMEEKVKPYMRLALSLKRQAHLSVLELQILLISVDFIKNNINKDSSINNIFSNEEKFIELKNKIKNADQKTADFRKRSNHEKIK